MMKNLKPTVVALCGLLAFSALSASADQEAIDNAIRQLGRGCNNVLTGILEIPANIFEVREEEGDLAALTYGTFRGIYRFLVREVVGVFEIVTFPVGFQPIVHPEFGGALGTISKTYEPQMRSTINTAGEWRLAPLERKVTR